MYRHLSMSACLQVYIVAVAREKDSQTARLYNGKGEDNEEEENGYEHSRESLLSLVQPELANLSSHWFHVLKDYALLSLPSGESSNFKEFCTSADRIFLCCFMFNSFDSVVLWSVQIDCRLLFEEHYGQKRPCFLVLILFCAVIFISNISVFFKVLSSEAISVHASCKICWVCSIGLLTACMSLTS